MRHNHAIIQAYVMLALELHLSHKQALALVLVCHLCTLSRGWYSAFM